MDSPSQSHIHLLPLPLSNHSARLPVELLTDIFLYCADGAVDAVHTIHIPLILTQICSRWRTAALANAQLWSRLFIQIPTPCYGPIDGPTSSPICRRGTNPELVAVWLQRSGRCPLTAYVVWDNPPPNTRTHPILESLLEVSHRWKTMFFYLPLDTFKGFARIRGRLPILSTLSLGTGDDDIPDGTETKMTMFEIAPNLRSLESINCSPTAFKLPWMQLEDIPILSGSIDECLDVFDRGRRLEKVGFVFTEGNWADNAAAYRTTTYHAHLRSFTIMTSVWGQRINLNPLLSSLSFPNLQSLTICNVKCTLGSEFIQFLSGLHNLTTLHLRKTNVTDEQLVQGLRHLSSLTHLMIHSLGTGPNGSGESTTVTRYFLDALTCNFFCADNAEVVLPRLRELQLTVSDNVAREPDFFLDMVQSRLRDSDCVSKLERVRMRLLVTLDEDFLLRLVELRQIGLFITVEDVRETEKCLSPI